MKLSIFVSLLALGAPFSALALGGLLDSAAATVRGATDTAIGATDVALDTAENAVDVALPRRSVVVMADEGPYVDEDPYIEEESEESPQEMSDEEIDS